MQASM